jgi:hypothetical protein
MSILGYIKNIFRGSTPTDGRNAQEIELFVPKENVGLFYPESDFVVTCNDQMVSCKRPDGTVESVTWADLKAVIMETNDQGPAFPDIFFLLIGESSGCIVPHGATGDGELITGLQRLPGFDNEQLIAAMGSCNDAHFLCWNSEKSS